MERDLLSGGAREASLREESEKTRLFFQDRCEHRKRRYREKFLISSEKESFADSSFIQRSKYLYLH